MDRLILPKQLEDCQRVLIAGAGGGFDVYAGLPIYHRLRAMGKNVSLANLSFTDLENATAVRIGPGLYVVERITSGEESYFPERSLCRFLERRFQESVVVYAIENTGAKIVREAYATLARDLELDAVVLIDGGTDILLRGDEAGLGTPAEDMVSLAAAHELKLRSSTIFCVGFGVDAFHGVCHANWLENVAHLSSLGGFLGAMALLSSMPEVEFYLDAIRDADLTTINRPSIVNGSIASALEGRFGDYHRYPRTHGSELFISLLMVLMWAFDLNIVANQNLYLDLIGESENHNQVLAIIEQFHAGATSRSRRPIPV